MSATSVEDKSHLAIYRVARKDKVRGQSHVPTTSNNNALAMESTKGLQPTADGLVETISSMNFVDAWRQTSEFGQHGNTSGESSTLDTNTLRWRSWCRDSYPHNTSTDFKCLNMGMESHRQQPFYHLTKILYSFPVDKVAPPHSKPREAMTPPHSQPREVMSMNEFRKLTEQLRDVSWNLSNRFKGLGFNRFKGYPNSESVTGNTACLYRSQLATSNKAFSDVQMWKPYVHRQQQRPETAHARCKPVNHVIVGREPRARTAIPSSRVRCKSASITNSRCAQDVTWGDYDMLTADVVQEMQSSQTDNIQSKFGERLTIIGKDNKGEKHMVIESNGKDPALHEGLSYNRLSSESSTSGVVSLDSDDVEEDVEHERGPQLHKAVGNQVPSGDSSVGREEPSCLDEDKSDDETIPEPATPADRNDIKMPKMDQALRPERLDAHAVFEGKKDRYRYEFDALVIRQPRYEFNNIFSPALMSLDLRAIAEREATLELKPTVSQEEARILMRCLELEKLQLATEKEEDSRYSKTKQYIRQRSASTALSRARAQSAKSSKSNLKCTARCTQVVCVGDCPDKTVNQCSCSKESCNFCGPSSQCTALNKQSNGSNSNKPQRLARPSSCGSCSRLNNPAKKINQHQTQLGRPKSSHYTYSRANKSVRQPMDLRASTQQIDFDETTINYVGERPSTAPTRLVSVRRGRESVAPHKSYFSQRRISLTASTIRPIYGVPVTSSKRRARSAKQRN